MENKQPYKKTYTEDEEENLFQDLLFKFLPWWPLFLLLVLLGAGGAWFYLRYKVPVYSTSASILIKDEKKGLDDSKALEALDIFGSKKIVENEIEVIQSKTLAQEVVKRLHLYAPVTIEGRVTDRSGYVNAPLVISVQNPDSLIATKEKVYFKYLPAQQKVELDSQAYAINTWINTRYGTLKFEPNPYFTASSNDTEDEGKEARPLYFNLVPVKTAANGMIARMKVAASSKQSTVINLSIEDNVPKRGEDILNNLIAVYNQAAVQDKNTQAANTLHFVEDRLKYVVNELDSVEGQLKNFKARNEITDISTQGQIFLQTVSANDQKISDISVQLAALDQVESYVKGKNGKGNIVPATLGIADPVLSSLLEKLYTTELEYERMRKIVPENNPSVVSLVDEMEKIKPGILENIRSQRRSLEAGKGDLAATNNRYSSMLRTIPEKERELLGISRQQGIKNNIYTFLLQKREEAALSYASTVPDSRIVDRAESGDKPVSPKGSLIYLIAVVGALGLGIGSISAKDMLTRTIQGRQEIEKYTNTPILGEVVHAKTSSPLVVGEGKRTVIAEQFRHLRTSLGYLGINSKKKKVLLTSSISGEGKSFVTANLGISLALMGKKVVLIELDLRKPKLADAFGIDRKVGITNFLIEQKEAVEIIRNTTVNNLFLIPSGPIPPNPSELLLNGRMQELLAYLEGQFDYILIDTAPVSPVTDAYILSPICDATLYLVRDGYTPKVFVQKMDDGNKIHTLKNMAIVYNDIKSKGFGKYGYGYNSGYGYGYGYGYAEEEVEVKKGLKAKLTKMFNF
jgi:tyrosine-protein kinase Etk/Wzc